MLPGFFSGLALGLAVSSVILWIATKKYRMATQMFLAATEEYTRAKEIHERARRKT